MLPSVWKDQTRFPVWNLWDEIERLFEGLHNGRSFPVTGWGNGNGHMPVMDVRDTDEAWIVEAELPGLKQNDFEVKVEDGVLSICAERKHEKDEKTKTYHRTERYYGRMERKLALPGTVEADKVEAAYKDGILQITLPKKAGSKPRTVKVK